MSENITATSSTSIDAPPARVWEVITDVGALGEMMGGATVTAAWRPGGDISWSGEYDGRPFHDAGRVVTVEPNNVLCYTHVSGSAPSTPENEHRLTWTLEGSGPTTLTLTQDNNHSAEEAARSKEMWDGVVEAVRERAERAG